MFFHNANSCGLLILTDVIRHTWRLTNICFCISEVKMTLEQHILYNLYYHTNSAMYDSTHVKCSMNALYNQSLDIFHLHYIFFISIHDQTLVSVSFTLLSANQNPFSSKCLALEYRFIFPPLQYITADLIPSM